MKKPKPILVVSVGGVALCIGVYVGLKRYLRAEPAISLVGGTSF
jgi:hypothetical protein